MASARGWLPSVWALLLSLMMLGPALAPGFVLAYDMVWVPDLRLTRDALGVGTALPRAVPSDAVVALVDTLVPGAVLQKVVLAASLASAGLGAARLVARRSLAVQLFAATLAIWNPFVVERLGIGHWPVLVGYAAVFWILVLSRRWDEEGRLPWQLPLVVLAGALSASAGLAAAVALLAGRIASPACRWGIALLLALAANAPWLVAGLLHGADATSAGEAAHVFATSGEGLLPGPIAALTLGGIWNAEVVPATRSGLLGVGAAVVLAALTAIGWRRAPWRPVGGWWPLLVCWFVGLGIAVLSAVAPSVLAWVADTVPGGGLLRDGSRLLGLAVPLAVVATARGVEALLDGVAERPARVLAGVVLAVAPLFLLPDAAWGLGGRLQAVHYPPTWQTARAEVATAPDGDVVLLPFTSYRAPAWNGGDKVVNPLARFLGRDAVVNDELYVDGAPIPGEDPRAAAVATALNAVTAADRAAKLAELGVSVVASEEIPGQAAPEVAGTTTSHGEVTITKLDQATSRRAVPAAWWVGMTVAWACWLLLAGVALSVAVTNRRRRRLT